MSFITRAIAIVVVASTAGCQGCEQPQPSVNATGARRLEEMAHACAHAANVTFLVASDTHFGFDEATNAKNLEAISAMNAIEGTAWPQAIGGFVGKPCGVIVTGDLTENGNPEEWKQFVDAFGLAGGEGALKYPVFETLGNHDKNAGTFVRDGIYERHGSTVYAFDWGPLHMVSLGEAPDDTDLDWLENDLDRTPASKSLVLYLHFPLDGKYSTGQWFGDGPYRDRFETIVAGRKVAGVFHGHYHATGLYTWRGLDAYRTGSPKSSEWHTFTVVEATSERMKVASWSYDAKGWVWWHAKPLAGDGPVIRYARPDVPE